MTISAAPPLGRTQTLAFGYWCGVTMSLCGAVAFAGARFGIVSGLTADDLMLARYAVSGLILLPALFYWGISDLAGIGWRRGIVLAIFGGVPFSLLQVAGFAFAPLAHGAVIAPSTVTILSTIAAGIFLGETITRSHLAGAVLVVVGIVLIGWHGIAGMQAGGTVWIGDMLFVVSSGFWAVFTVLIRYWQVNAIRATAVISVLSMFGFLPLYLTFRGPAHVAALPLVPMLTQCVMQGLIQAVITIMAYNRAITILGVSRAVLFPAVIPALTVLVGIPMVGEWPNGIQVAGLTAVSIGMMLAVGLFNRWRRPAVALD